MAIGDQYRRITPDDQLIFNAANQVVGIKSGHSTSTEGRMLTPTTDAAVQALVTGAGTGDPQFYIATGLGDSITQGDGGYTDDSNYTAASVTLYEQICRLSGGRIIRRRNAGIAGQTSAQILARFATDVPAETTLLIIHAGTNDPGTLTEDQTAANVQAMIVAGKVMSSAPKIVVCGLPPKNTATTAIQSINRRFAALCRSLGAQFIQPWARFFAGDGTWASGGSGDGVHPAAATALTAANDWLTQFYGYAPPEVPFILPVENADPKSRLYLSSTANSCFMTDTNSDGVPDGWNKTTDAAFAVSLAAATYPAIGKALTLTCTGITSVQSASRTSASGTLKAGQWHLVVVRITATGCVAGGVQWKVSLSGPGYGAQTSFIPRDGTYLITMMVKGLAADTYCIASVAVTNTSGAASGVVAASQFEMFLASDLGITL